MARTLSEIYSFAKECRKQYLELTEWENDSKMSILDAITWVQSSCIWAFENIIDVFKIDLAKDLQNRINGTPGYYANALLKYQSGDELEMNDEGTSFSYPTIDETKRVITKVAYSESVQENFHDKLLVLKIATGNPGAYQQIDSDEMVAIRAYVNQIAFAGTSITIVSRKGDVLVPKFTVYYDGAITEEEVYTNIENSINQFIADLDFNGFIYTQKLIDAIQSAEHVLDVHISTTGNQGLFVAQYDDDNNLIEVNGEALQQVDRFFIPNSGYVKESTREGVEAELPTWRESIILQIENNVN
ncbi:MAG: hypothetical protein J6O49_07055 [Bacteroidaceae bacterium]|nr:hypothetical protein [Bacteroidaceae bacterium]